MLVELPVYIFHSSSKIILNNLQFDLNKETYCFILPLLLDTTNRNF